MQVLRPNHPEPDGAFEDARLDLELARQWFDWVTEPHLVDEAIYRLRAAEMRLTAITHGRRGRPSSASDPADDVKAVRIHAIAR